MKNIVSFVAFAIFATTYSNAYAQNLETISSASISQLKETNAGHPVMRNQVPARAYRHFIKAHDNTKDETWQLDGTGFVALFYKDGMSQMSFYDQKGNWMSSVFNYNQAKLPKRVFELIKSAYCDYAITHCSEVKTNATSAYHVTILKDTDYKILKIQNEEIQLLNQYTYDKGQQNGTTLTKQ